VLPALAAAFIYLQTLAPGVTGLDSAELATGAHSLGIVHPTGYPLYLLLAHGFMALPVGSIAFRANLFSALFGVLGIALVGLLCCRLTGRVWAAAAASFLLAVAVSYWKLSVVAEVYTLHTFFLVLLFLFAERALATRRPRWLAGMALAFGLSLANHVTGILYAPVLVWVAWRVLPRRLLSPVGLGLVLVALLGLLPYAYLPLRAASNPPLNYVRDYYAIDLRTPSGLWWMMTGQAYRFFAFGYDLPGYLRELGYIGQLLWRNFTGLGIALGLLGLGTLAVRRSWAIVPTLWVFLSTVLFFAGYGVTDKETMLLPAYLVWAVWLSAGVAAAYDGAGRTGDRFSLGHAYPKGAVLASVALLAMACTALNWRSVDMSEAVGAEQRARETLRIVQPNAVVRGGWSTAVVLEYLQQVEGLRPDVTVFNTSRFEVAEYYRLWKDDVPYAKAIDQIEAIEREYFREMYVTRPVYDAGYDLGLAEDYEYRPVGALFRLVARSQGG
jgi:4-amino-4-deoxy-L-arabinose transferase-like glycosyltransferase